MVLDIFLTSIIVYVYLLVFTWKKNHVRQSNKFLNVQILIKKKKINHHVTYYKIIENNHIYVKLVNNIGSLVDYVFFLWIIHVFEIGKFV